jgi:hypothetical protein
MRGCLQGIVTLFGKFGSAKWEAGDAWEALFLIALIVRYQTTLFDEHVVPLGSYMTGNVSVMYNCPVTGTCNFSTTKPEEFIEGIPVQSPEPEECAISIYYPGHSRFEDFDIILAFWDMVGTRYLYGYQLKEGKTAPTEFAYDQVFHCSFLIRGAATQQSGTVRLWRSVSEAQLDAFFGVSAVHWSAKKMERAAMSTPSLNPGYKGHRAEGGFFDALFLAIIFPADDGEHQFDPTIHLCDNFQRLI